MNNEINNIEDYSIDTFKLILLSLRPSYQKLVFCPYKERTWSRNFWKNGFYEKTILKVVQNSIANILVKSRNLYDLPVKSWFFGSKSLIGQLINQGSNLGKKIAKSNLLRIQLWTESKSTKQLYSAEMDKMCTV